MISYALSWIGREIQANLLNFSGVLGVLLTLWSTVAFGQNWTLSAYCYTGEFQRNVPVKDYCLSDGGPVLERYYMAAMYLYGHFVLLVLPKFVLMLTTTSQIQSLLPKFS